MALGRWGLYEFGRLIIQLAERGAERQNQTERPPWKTLPPGGAAPGTHPHPCCHSFLAGIPAGPHLHRCPSVQPGAGRARHFRDGSRLGGGGGVGPGSGAGVAGRQLACEGATGCMMGPVPHLHPHCLAIFLSAAETEPEWGESTQRKRSQSKSIYYRYFIIFIIVSVVTRALTSVLITLTETHIF